MCWEKNECVLSFELPSAAPVEAMLWISLADHWSRSFQAPGTPLPFVPHRVWARLIGSSFSEVGVVAQPHCSLPKTGAVADCLSDSRFAVYTSTFINLRPCTLSPWVLTTLVSGYRLQFRPSLLFGGKQPSQLRLPIAIFPRWGRSDHHNHSWLELS